MLIGTILALFSGVLLGFFQISHRKANEGKADNPLSMVILLAAGFLVVALVVLFSPSRALLRDLSWFSIACFSISGIIHFFLGFLLFSYSQRLIGVSRTGVLVGATPVFAAITGLIAFGEKIVPIVMLGIFIVVSGIALVSRSRNADQKIVKKRYFFLGLGSALCYSISPLFIKYGLTSFDSPIIGVAVGMAAALIAFILMFIIGQKRHASDAAVLKPDKKNLYEVFAGVFMSIATWFRYIALTTTPLAVVTTMTRLSIPVVLILSPLLLRSRNEKSTVQTWTGAGLIIIGSILIGFWR
jgi:drug/metabolite transporter (DMT)-like permease